MKCNEIRELMPDLAAGLNAVTPEMKTHLDSCAECAGKLEAFRQTMSLRLRARLREELQKQASGFLQWLRRPALAISFAVLMVVSVTLVRFTGSGSKHGPQQIASVPAEPGTAVGDLQALDKNHDLYSDFDVLDDLTVQQDVTANP